ALTEGLTQKPLSRAIRGALEKVPAMPEWQDGAFLKQRGFPSFHDALAKAHAPAAQTDLAPESPARQRLAYDELLANQLALMLIRAGLKLPKGRVISCKGVLKARAIAALPFALTDGQLGA